MALYGSRTKVLSIIGGVMSALHSFWVRSAYLDDGGGAHRRTVSSLPSLKGTLYQSRVGAGSLWGPWWVRADGLRVGPPPVSRY